MKQILSLLLLLPCALNAIEESIGVDFVIGKAVFEEQHLLVMAHGGTNYPMNQSATYEVTNALKIADTERYRFLRNPTLKIDHIAKHVTLHYTFIALKDMIAVEEQSTSVSFGENIEQKLPKGHYIHLYAKIKTPATTAVNNNDSTINQ